MFAYIVRRVLATIPVMAFVALFVFSLLYVAPGDPAAVIATGFSLEWAAVCDAPSARSVRTVRSDRGPPTDRA